MLWIYILFIAIVYADMHTVAVQTLEGSEMCGNESLLKLYKEKIIPMVDTADFNENVEYAIKRMEKYKDIYDREIIFKSMLTFLSDKQSPMCIVIADTNIDSLTTFVSVLFRAFYINPLLERFSELVFFPVRSFYIRYYFEDKHVELAQFFIVYSKHPISQKISF